MTTNRQTASNILDAVQRNLPPCPMCEADKGDPCRTPQYKARKPHKERERLFAKQERGDE